MMAPAHQRAQAASHLQSFWSFLTFPNQRSLLSFPHDQFPSHCSPPSLCRTYRGTGGSHALREQPPSPHPAHPGNTRNASGMHPALLTNVE